MAVEYNGSFTIDTQLAKWNDTQEVYGMGYGGKLPTSSASGTNSSWGPKAETSFISILMVRSMLS